DDLFPEMPVLLSGEIGKGRIVVSGETFFMQPFNIEKGDNLQLAWNIMAWLTRGKIKQKPVQELKQQLWFTEKMIEDMEKEEGF
ncbi:MAG TPA: hypothetical protein DC049_12475, partial [Spirochaetia bacterium]|nr:hypothetical protein [Spirochaetia bacterium]